MLAKIGQETLNIVLQWTMSREARCKHKTQLNSG